MSNVTITGMSIPNAQIPLGSNKTGTCGVTNNSVTVTFATALGRVYRNKGGFLIKLNSTIHYASHVAEDGLSLTVTSAYVGITDAAATYIIYPCLELRFYCDTAFQPRGASYVIQASAVGSTAFFKSVLVSQYDAGTGDLLWIPELILPATGDIASPPQQKAKYQPVFYTLTGSQVAYLSGFERGLKVPETPSTTNWPDLLVANQTQPFNFINETSTLSSDQVLALISSAGAIDGTHRTLLMAASGGVAAEDSALSQDVSGNLIAANDLNLGGSIEVVDDAIIGGSLEAADAAITGAVTAASATLSGALAANSAAITGAVTAASATLTGALNSNTAAVTGAVTAASVVLSGALTSASATVSGAVSAGSAAVTNALTVGTTATVTGETDLIGGFKTRTAVQVATLTAGNYGRLTWQTDALRGFKKDYGATIGIKHAQPYYDAYEQGFIPTASDSTTRTANSETWAAFITALPATGGILRFPEGVFYFATELSTTKPVIIEGAGAAFVAGDSNPGTTIFVENGQNGFRFLSNSPTSSARGSHLRNLTIKVRGGFTGYTTGDGIYSDVTVHLDNVSIEGFGRDGVYLEGTAPANSDFSTLRRVDVWRVGRDGFHYNGGDDTNVIKTEVCNSTLAGRHGFYNAGYSNVFDTCHVAYSDYANRVSATTSGAITLNASPQTVTLSNVTNISVGMRLTVDTSTSKEYVTVTALPGANQIEAIFANNHSGGVTVKEAADDYHENAGSNIWLMPYSETTGSERFHLGVNASYCTVISGLFGAPTIDPLGLGLYANHNIVERGYYRDLRLKDTGDSASGHNYLLVSRYGNYPGEFYIRDETDSKTLLSYNPATEQMWFPRSKLAFDGILLASGTPQTLTGPGAINLTTHTTLVVTTGTDALTLAAGAEGQFKFIRMKTDGGDGTITVTNLQGGTTITMDDEGDSVYLLYQDAKWNILTNNGCAVA